MTNKEMIIELRYTIDLIKQNGRDWLDERDIPILEAAISALQEQEETVSRKVYEQISWERDIAVMQLKDLGYSLGEKIRTDGNLISRADAIDAAMEYGKKIPTYAILVKNAIEQLPSAQPEIKPIDYQDCANAMLRMWMDGVVTDGEYNRIMDKLNAFWRTRNERYD